MCHFLSYFITIIIFQLLFIWNCIGSRAFALPGDSLQRSQTRKYSLGQIWTCETYRFWFMQRTFKGRCFDTYILWNYRIHVRFKLFEFRSINKCGKLFVIATVTRKYHYEKFGIISITLYPIISMSLLSFSHLIKHLYVRVLFRNLNKESFFDFWY